MGRTKRSKHDSLNPEDIICGMFCQNKEETEIDDSYFMPMLRMCLNTLAENSQEAGLPESEIRAIHDALYQHSLDEYVKGWLQNAREDGSDIDEEEEIEEATDSFEAFYEGYED